MKHRKWFVIDDLDRFIESTRVIVYDGFGPDSNHKDANDLANQISQLTEDAVAELNEVLSQNECLIISKDFIKIQKNKKTKERRLILDNISFRKMIECFNNRMVGNMLNNLVNKGLLETAYDEESNDFIFWVKDDKNSEKPEAH